MNAEDSTGSDRHQMAEESMRRLVEAGKQGGRGLIDHSILAGGVFDDLVARVKNGEGENLHVLNIGAGYRARMEREVAQAKGDIGQEPFFIIDSPTFSKEKNKEEVLRELSGDKVERAVTIDDFAHNLESVPDNFCDYVFAVNLFQHMLAQDIPKALQEIVRVLKPGGRAVIVPIFEPLQEEPDVPGNRPWRAVTPKAELRLSVPQLELLRLDLQDLPRNVDAPITVNKEEIPFDMFVMAQGGDLERKPLYTPYRVLITKIQAPAP